VIETRHGVTLHHGDCLDVLRTLPDASVDAVVTDPPYELSFMGRGWDATGIAYNVGLWRDCLRVLKPGGHLLAFGGTRTWHRLACAIEDAGFEVRDSIAWVYASGFPKSLDVSKAIDKAAGAERETKSVPSAASAYAANAGNLRPWMQNDGTVQVAGDTPATDAARQWQGWGTALKPAHEPIVVARKPLAGTVAANVLAHGTGALNVDGCRVGTDGWGEVVPGLGRWPANLVLSHAPDCAERCEPGCPVAELDEQSGTLQSFTGQTECEPARGADSGGASRFFPTFRYQAKADTAERPRQGGTAHPTVKPLDLMRWLVRLVTPPGGTVLEPFAGSGATVEACLLEGFGCIAIEREADYLPLIRERIDRQRDPLAYVVSKAETDDDLGLFGLLEGA
jgi:DNA modification methylase